MPSSRSAKRRARRWSIVSLIYSFLIATLETELRMEPHSLTFDEKGGLKKVKLHNPTGGTIFFKVKCSANDLYVFPPLLIFPFSGIALAQSLAKLQPEKRVIFSLFARPVLRNWTRLSCRHSPRQMPMRRRRTCSRTLQRRLILWSVCHWWPKPYIVCGFSRFGNKCIIDWVVFGEKWLFY